jgi:aarF domain-containing kinase
VVLAATTGSLALGALAFQDEAKHAYHAVERTGRVAGTLALCINE